MAANAIWTDTGKTKLKMEFPCPHHLVLAAFSVISLRYTKLFVIVPTNSTQQPQTTGPLL